MAGKTQHEAARIAKRIQIKRLGLLYLSTILSMTKLPINDPTAENIKKINAWLIFIAPAMAN